MGVQVQPCCCGDKFFVATSPVTVPTAGNVPGPSYLWRMRGRRLTKGTPITWPSNPSENELHKINGNATVFGIEQHPETRVLFLCGDTGVSGSSPAVQNSVASRCRLYTVNIKNGLANEVGKFGALGNQDALTDIAIDEDMPTEAVLASVNANDQGNFGRVDLLSGAATSLVSWPLVPATSLPPTVVAMDYHPETRELWALVILAPPVLFSPNRTVQIAKLDKYTMDITDAVTVSPAIPMGQFRYAMAFDDSGVMWICYGGDNGPPYAARIRDLQSGVVYRTEAFEGPPPGQRITSMCRIRSLRPPD